MNLSGSSQELTPDRRLRKLQEGQIGTHERSDECRQAIRKHFVAAANAPSSVESRHLSLLSYRARSPEAISQEVLGIDTILAGPCLPEGLGMLIGRDLIGERQEGD